MKSVIAILILILIISGIRINYFSNMKQNVLYDTAYELGVHYLEIIKNLEIRNPTVMFDIDDTLLYVNDDYSLTPIKSMIKLLNYCIRNGFIVLIITARDSRSLAQTKKDLSKNKIRYDYLYLRMSPQDDHHLFKSDAKKMYLDHYHLTTVMSVGDNEIDINGPYSGYSIKLPNKSDPRLFHINTYGKLENVIP